MERNDLTNEELFEMVIFRQQITNNLSISNLLFCTMLLSKIFLLLSEFRVFISDNNNEITILDDIQRRYDTSTFIYIYIYASSSKN